MQQEHDGEAALGSARITGGQVHAHEARSRWAERRLHSLDGAGARAVRSVVATLGGDVETADATVDSTVVPGTVGALAWGGCAREDIADAATRNTTSAAARMG